ncbi:MAG: AraC family transcriptional regulator [Acidobacteria bacterium]|nr:MAG: AraC family transcriptional regulator [Acidobacteriota bacterium]
MGGRSHRNENNRPGGSPGRPLAPRRQPVGESVGALSRRFKAEMGVGFRHYRRTVRLRRAEELLRQSSWSIKQVARSVGYRHVGDFCRHFKQTYGLPPSTYRHMVTRATDPRQG